MFSAVIGLVSQRDDKCTSATQGNSRCTISGCVGRRKRHAIELWQAPAGNSGSDGSKSVRILDCSGSLNRLHCGGATSGMSASFRTVCGLYTGQGASLKKLGGLVYARQDCREGIRRGGQGRCPSLIRPRSEFLPSQGISPVQRGGCESRAVRVSFRRFYSTGLIGSCCKE